MLVGNDTQWGKIASQIIDKVEILRLVLIFLLLPQFSLSLANLVSKTTIDTPLRYSLHIVLY